MTPDEIPAAFNIPANRLTANLTRHLSEEERAAVQALGGLEALMQTRWERLEEQKGRHEGGTKRSEPATPLRSGTAGQPIRC